MSNIDCHCFAFGNCKGGRRRIFEDIGIELRGRRWCFYEVGALLIISLVFQLLG
jgi:hypothetical protein